uniref:Uncharacterized protein n=1 Tax=Arundo donax TaxID=35708 RepID=A0A0A9HHB4_ARUDO
MGTMFNIIQALIPNEHISNVACMRRKMSFMFSKLSNTCLICN